MIGYWHEEEQCYDALGCILLLKIKGTCDLCEIIGKVLMVIGIILHEDHLLHLRTKSINK